MKLKIYLKNNIKSILKVLVIYAILICLFTIPINYEIYTPGGLIDISDRIKIDNDYELSGSFNLTYVSGKKGILPLVLLSYIIPSWDLEPISSHQIENESYDDIVAREQLFLKSGVQNSVINAFKEANIDIGLSNPRLVVNYVLEDAETDLKIKDEIKEINGVSVNSFQSFYNELIKCEEKDNIEIKVVRNNKEIITNSKLKIKENQKMIGIMLTTFYDFNTNPSVEFIYKNSESGSSGGLMNALYIYSVITQTDLTKGSKLAGTGTIESDGTIGTIGGLKYKIAGAVKNKAEVFITGSENIEEARKIIEENNYDIELIEAKDLHDIIVKLLER